MRGVALLLLCACGGYTPARYCQALYQASCPKLFECVPDQKLYTSEADCEQKQALAFDCSSVGDDLCTGQGSGTFNSAAAAQCIDDIRALSCAAVVASGFALPSTCEPSAVCR